VRPEAPELADGRRRREGVLDRRTGRGRNPDRVADAPSPDDVVVRALPVDQPEAPEALVFQGRVPPSEFQRCGHLFRTGAFPPRSSTATPASA
jgi:hypothetical protein